MKEIPKAYDQSKESDIYKLWEESGFFNPDNLEGEPFTIIMPPGNANGQVHVGHALGFTLQDIMIRYARMQGKKTLWLPGSDHAGFETQVVFEKKLEKEGRSRFQMTREEFYKETWDFVQENKVKTEEGVRRLGASVDWSRNMFTLDPRIVKIVYETFEQMYEDGLVYRGNRICNWCPKHQTGLSDLETTYEERTDPLYYIKYGELEVATVRPETIFGDAALAVNPKDQRYEKFIGKEMALPKAFFDIFGFNQIKVIGDDAVETEFGTGVVKVTPAHDALDFEIWQRHEKEIPPFNQVIDKRGKLDISGNKYSGSKAAEVRKQVVEEMQSAGLISKIDNQYKHNVTLCYKCKSVLEPLIIPQWYVAMTKATPSGKSFRDIIAEAIENRSVKINPESKANILKNWLTNIRDWPISRQIWWGIPIPVWYKKLEKPIQIKYFVHGSTSDNENNIQSGHKDTELSELGRKQATELKEAVKNEVFDIIICSDLKRAHETAKIAFGERYEIITDSRLRECNYGDFNGRDDRKINKTDYIDRAYPNGESYKDVQKRIEDLLKDLAHKYPGKRLALLAHQAPQLSLNVLLNGMSWQEAFRKDWRNTKSYQHGWDYEFKELIHVGEEKPEGDDWKKDPDTFDTWFSSGQWPYATLMALGKKDFETFYPTSVMETGWDIIFFWVARMIMFGVYKTGKVPFKYVYLHGLVRDKDRQKMSKSKGNVIDPLGVIDTYGNDALRMALTVGNLPGNDLPLSEDKVRGYRNFANKIWNAARFVYSDQNNSDGELLPADQTILDELDQVVKKTTEQLDRQDLAHAAEDLYHYFWHTFADKIIEESKAKLNDEKTKASAQKMLLTVLETNLRMLHPFVPFVTEAIWQLNHKDLLMIQKWPK